MYIVALIPGQYQEATADLLEAIDFLKEVYSHDLNGYSGDNIHYILDTLKRKRPTDDDTMRLPLRPSCPNSSFSSSFPSYSIVNHLTDSGVRIDAAPNRRSTGGWDPRPVEETLTTRREPRVPAGEEKNIARGAVLIKYQRPEIPVNSKTGGNEATFDKFSMQMDTSVLSPQDPMQLNDRTSSEPIRLRKRTANRSEHRRKRSGKRRRNRTSRSHPATIRTDSQNLLPSAENGSSFTEINSNSSDGYYRKYSYAANLLKIAHMLHYVGIGILGIFVVQVNC